MSRYAQLFTHYVLRQYEHLQKERLTSGIHLEFIEYLIEEQLILNETIKHYTLKKEYETMMKTKAYKNKTQTIRHLADKYGLHESTVWGLMKSEGKRIGEDKDHYEDKDEGQACALG